MVQSNKYWHLVTTFQPRSTPCILFYRGQWNEVKVPRWKIMVYWRYGIILNITWEVSPVRDTKCYHRGRFYHIIRRTNKKSYQIREIGSLGVHANRRQFEKIQWERTQFPQIIKYLTNVFHIPRASPTQISGYLYLKSISNDSKEDLPPTKISQYLQKVNNTTPTS